MEQGLDMNLSGPTMRSIYYKETRYCAFAHNAPTPPSFPKFLTRGCEKQVVNCLANEEIRDIHK